MTHITSNEISEGSRVRIQTTGHIVVVRKISSHGIAIVEYDFGYRRMLLLRELMKETTPANDKLNVA